MIAEDLYGFQTKLARTLDISDNKIYLDCNIDINKLKNSIPFDLVVRNGNYFEVVKILSYDGNDGGFLISRSQDGSSSRTFISGSCVKFDWSPTNLCTFIKGCIGSPYDTGVVAGTYSIGCGGIMDVGKDGKIYKIRTDDECQ